MYDGVNTARNFAVRAPACWGGLRSALARSNTGVSAMPTTSRANGDFSHLAADVSLPLMPFYYSPRRLLRQGAE